MLYTFGLLMLRGKDVRFELLNVRLADRHKRGPTALARKNCHQARGFSEQGERERDGTASSARRAVPVAPATG